MQYILMLKKKINKLLTFYNYKSRAKSTGSYFYAVFLVVRLYKTNKINFKQL
jgi:hypothetical protein